MWNFNVKNSNGMELRNNESYISWIFPFQWENNCSFGFPFYWDALYILHHYSKVSNKMESIAFFTQFLSSPPRWRETKGSKSHPSVRPSVRNAYKNLNQTWLVVTPYEPPWYDEVKSHISRSKVKCESLPARLLGLITFQPYACL